MNPPQFSHHDLIVTDVDHALKLAENAPGQYRIVSIVSASPILRCVPVPFRIPGAKEALYLEFDDVNAAYAHAQGFRPATREDCQAALDFLSKGGQRIIHCEAGISRSTGMALGYLLSVYGDYHHAVDKLFELRPRSSPNSHILLLICQLLNRDHEYQQIEDYIDDIRRYRRPTGLSNPSTSEIPKWYYGHDTM